MTAIVTLRFPDQDAHSSERDEIKTYGDLIEISVNPATGFLMISTESGDYSFDPAIWKSFVVSRDPQDSPRP